ncbi:hypothetical protein [Actinospica robiniae]|uniref:hypothetical protein n=1 Tax=Actinospica robiniae TaxID=304901 RepID=UPI0003FE97A0|nr:hypothetical protein [Actinospica robiniae]
MLIAIGSQGSSPGVSTLALALAGFWPTDAATVVVEADPAGGDMKSWQRVPGEPGLGALATAARHSADPATVFAHASALPGGLNVVTAPEGPDQASAAVQLLARDGAGLLRALSADQAITVLDLGRLDPASSTLDLLAYADLTLIVARPNLAEITRLAARIATIKQYARDPEAVSLVLSGTGYPADAVAESQQTPVLAVLPRDEACAGVLSGSLTMRRGLDRTRLARAARTLGHVVIQRQGALVSANARPVSKEADA